MSAIRFWVFLLTVLLAAAAALVVTLPQSLIGDLDRAAAHHLDGSRRAAAMMLRLNARKWIDTTAKVANDAVLTDALDEATRGPADLQIIHRTVQDRLKAFNDQMKVELVLATDAHGRVIARTGVDAATYKDNIEGYPLVGDALRGLRGDDTWSLGGKLYRVAASPVILRDHYVGSVVLGQEVGTELAESMKSALGSDVVLLLHGRVIASTAALPILDRLPTAAEQTGEAPLKLDGYLAAVASFPGEASAQHAQYALVLPRRGGASPLHLLSQLVPKDMRALPVRLLAPIGAGAFVLLILGFVLVSVFGAAPIERLARDAQALSRGEITRLPEPTRGATRTIAHAVNTLLERVAGRVRVESRGSLPAFDRPPEPMRPSNTPTPLPTAMPMSVTPPGIASTLLAPVSVHRDESAPTAATPLAPSPATPPLIMSDEFEDQKTSAAARPRYLPPSASLSSLGGDTSPHGVLPMPHTERPTAPAIVRRIEETTMESPSEARLMAAANETNDEIEADFRRVYNEFVATRETCGETLEGVTFDKFVAKLRQNRAQLIERYGCTSVKFQVYIRDGKAALKATPVT